MRRRPALFHGYVLEDGKQRRATRDELTLAWRLWCRHADVRLGRVRSAPTDDPRASNWLAIEEALR